CLCADIPDCRSGGVPDPEPVPHARDAADEHLGTRRKTVITLTSRRDVKGPDAFDQDLKCERLRSGDAAEVSMPTQIPVYVERSYVAEAIVTLILSLLAAVVDGVAFFTIVWV